MMCISPTTGSPVLYASRAAKEPVSGVNLGGFFIAAVL